MDYRDKEVRVRAYFADQRYAKDGAMLELSGFGRGSFFVCCDQPRYPRCS